MSNDFDNFIRHDDFGKVLELAAALKQMQAATIALNDYEKGTNDKNSLSNSDSLHVRKKNKMDGKGVVTNTISSSDRPNAKSFSDAANLIRGTLISDDDSDDMCEVMGRGECLITDSLIDETIQCLAEELKLCVELKKQLRKGASIQHQGYTVPTSNAAQGMRSMSQSTFAETDAKVPVKMETVDRSGEEVGGGKAKGKNKAPPKFTKWQTDILIDWMIEHREHPFPTTEQIRSLAETLGLTETQVTNWTTNVRKRNLKATVDNGKKPHHFLDFLFLATDREKKLLRKNPYIDLSTFKDMRLFRGQESAPPAPNHGTPQPSLSGYASANTQQANIHRGQVAPPRAPTDQIFRQQEELMLQPTPPGFTRTPPGAIDAEMFTEEKSAVGSNADLKAPHVSFDGTDINNDMNAPYDESAEYLRRLVSSADTISDTRLV